MFFSGYSQILRKSCLSKCHSTPTPFCPPWHRSALCRLPYDSLHSIIASFTYTANRAFYIDVCYCIACSQINGCFRR